MAITFDNVKSLFTSGTTSQGKVTDISTIAGNLITWVFVIAGLVSVGYIVFYGIMFITSGGDPEKATKARNGLIYAIIGMIVIAATFFIMGFAFDVGKNPGSLKP